MSHDPAMDPDFPNQFRRPSSSTRVFWSLLGLAVSVAALAWVASPRSNLPFFASLESELLLPKIDAAGWINGPAPRPEDLRGKVVVIEVWASWCGPCREKMPQVVKLHEDYASRGVVFVGLTGEEETGLADIRKAIDRFGVTWPNGWGAMSTIHTLEAERIPVLFVFGANGRLAWYSPRGGDIREVLERELEKANTKSNSKPT